MGDFHRLYFALLGSNWISQNLTFTHKVPLAHNVSFWIKKLIHNVSFWIQKRNWQIMSVSGSRNWCFLSVCGSRNWSIITVSGSRFFWSRNWHLTSVSGSRNWRYGSVSGSRNWSITSVSGYRPNFFHTSLFLYLLFNMVLPSSFKLQPSWTKLSKFKNNSNWLIKPN